MSHTTDSMTFEIFVGKSFSSLLLFPEHGDIQKVSYTAFVAILTKADFLEVVHAVAAGHLKFSKCLDHIRSRSWWSSFRRDLGVFI